MKYFVNDHQRKGSSYHEFYKGKWDGKTFWKTDSIFLDDNILLNCKDFIDSIIENVPSYDPYGVTKISYDEWIKIGKIIITKDSKSQEIYNEADEWLKTVFTAYDCFTILGI